MSVLRFGPKRLALAAATIAGLAALTTSAALACDCDTTYSGDYYRYRHDDNGRAIYSCYGGGYDCRYEDSNRDHYRYGVRYDSEHDRHYHDRDRDDGRRW